jgi:hypothetical protein
MRIASTLVFIMLLGYAWLVAQPAAARSLVAHLKRSWRLYIIEHDGDRAAKRLFRRLRAEAERQGIGPEIVEAFIAKHHEEVAQRLGTSEANARLGEPTTLERYY